MHPVNGKWERLIKGVRHFLWVRSLKYSQGKHPDDKRLVYGQAFSLGSIRFGRCIL